MFLRTIDALAPLSNNILIVHTLAFLFSFEVSGLIWKFVEILPRSFGGENIPKEIGDKSVTSNNFSLFEINLFKVDLQDEI